MRHLRSLSSILSLFAFFALAGCFEEDPFSEPGLWVNMRRGATCDLWQVFEFQGDGTGTFFAPEVRNDGAIIVMGTRRGYGMTYKVDRSRQKLDIWISDEFGTKECHFHYNICDGCVTLQNAAMTLPFLKVDKSPYFIDAYAKSLPTSEYIALRQRYLDVTKKYQP